MRLRYADVIAFRTVIQAAHCPSSPLKPSPLLRLFACSGHTDVPPQRFMSCSVLYARKSWNDIMSVLYFYHCVTGCMHSHVKHKHQLGSPRTSHYWIWYVLLEGHQSLTWDRTLIYGIIARSSRYATTDGVRCLRVLTSSVGSLPRLQNERANFYLCQQQSVVSKVSDCTPLH